ncbi:hypothetical protein PR048_004927 [Dryococelus australis]|uniref:Reverse transcriptase domain-containing protein n=1 Tax=Dryococelus australis TaxID=614101 RepID=A0ABQ9I6T3_9NEOP|nr:hypothetical protein PR048_004927 [Dryococelus australis]
MPANCPAIPTFLQGTEPFENYIERLNLYFKVAETKETAKVAVLGITLPPEIYAVYSNAGSKKLNVTKYITAIKFIATTCKYWNFLDKALRDRLSRWLGSCWLTLKSLSLLVARDLSAPALLGRDWLAALQPGWQDHLLANSQVLSMHVVGTSGVANRAEVLVYLKSKYTKAFSVVNNDRPISGFKVSINLKGSAIPVFHRAYDVPYALVQNVKELFKLEQAGIISHVKSSPWASPIIAVPKNIPCLKQMIFSTNGCQVFCHLNLTQVYLQLEIEEPCRELLTINTINRLYRFNRLVFGLASAPAIFQSVIKSILFKIGNVAAYLDDILIGGKDRQECAKNLNLVLAKLDAYNVKINTDKSEFFVSSLEFLGFKFSGQGKSPTKSKLKEIMATPIPTDTTQLKLYLSLLNYYRQFIPICSKPSTTCYAKMFHGSECLSVSQPSTKAKQSFLKKALLVVFFYPTKEIVLHVDSSGYGVGAVLSHIIDGIECPTAFESATLTTAQRNYSQLDKKVLAVIFGFHKYLCGHPFTIVSDRQPLMSLFSEVKKLPQMVSSRILRWAVILSAYNYSIVYKKGQHIP